MREGVKWEQVDRFARKLHDEGIISGLSMSFVNSAWSIFVSGHIVVEGEDDPLAAAWRSLIDAEVDYWCRMDDADAQ